MTAPVGLAARGWGWRHATRKAWAVRGLDLTIEPGERVLLLGRSGGGKSTLLAGVAGLLTSGDEEGALLVGGVPARAARVQAVTAGSARVGLVLQDPQAQTILARCGDDVAFGLENHAVPAARIAPTVHCALDAVQFPYGASHPTAALSGGERQRLALAGVLALNPGLLLLDEPTSMLDPQGAANLRAQVARLLEGSGATCLLVDHRVGPWLPMVDRVIVLGDTGLIAAGPPHQVFQQQQAELAAAGIWLPGRPALLGRAALPDRPARELGQPLLDADQLTLLRPGRADPVIDRLDLTIVAGEALCLIGPNGSGKSTLAWALGGLLRPASGRLEARPALAQGAAVHPSQWRARELVARIGSVFQDPAHQFVAPTVEAELSVGPRQAGCSTDEIRSRTTELLERLGLTALARANPFTLSGGEQRRLSVATVLATRPALLVLDEPTFGLDARTWASLVELLLDLLADGTAVVAATHDEWLPEALGSQVLELAR